MMRLTIAALAIAFTTFAFAAFAFAQEAPAPEECLAKADNAAAVVITHGGKTYRMANEACRAQFLSDPERYSQLYDALLELEAEGRPLAPAAPSLVPS